MSCPALVRKIVVGVYMPVQISVTNVHGPTLFALQEDGVSNVEKKTLQ